MTAWICAASANQHADTPGPPASCVVCSDEHQWVPPSGQRWTSLEELAATGHRSEVRELEAGLIADRVEPSTSTGLRGHRRVGPPPRSEGPGPRGRPPVADAPGPGGEGMVGAPGGPAQTHPRAVRRALRRQRSGALGSGAGAKGALLVGDTLLSHRAPAGSPGSEAPPTTSPAPQPGRGGDRLAGRAALRPDLEGGATHRRAGCRGGMPRE